MAVKSVHILLSGRVQGVGYRYFAARKAEELQIKGWVRNNPDGRVEIEAEGEAGQLSIFADWLKAGPPRAIVTGISIEEFAPARNFTTFFVK